MVTRNHYGADTCASALYDSVLYLGANGVDHAAKTDEAKVVFKAFCLVVGRLCVIESGCTRKNAQRLVCHSLVCAENRCLVFVRHGDGNAVLKIVRTLINYYIGSALGVLNEGACRAVDRGHHLSTGVKGSFSRAGVFVFEVVLFHTELACPVNERCLRGFTRYVSVRVDLRITAKSHSSCDILLVLAEVIDNSHLVLRERTCLVGADYLRASERFNCRKTADYSVALGHIGNTDRENDGNNCRKSLGDRRNCERYCYHKRGKNGLGKAEVACSYKLNAKYDDTYAEDEPGQDLGELMKLSLQWSVALLCVLKRARDLTHLGIHTGCGNYGNTSAVYDGRAHIEHIFAVAEGNVALALFKVDGVDKLCYGNRFARKRGLLDLKTCVFKNSRVSGNGVACFEQNYVADNQILTADYLYFAVAQDL